MNIRNHKAVLIGTGVATTLAIFNALGRYSKLNLTVQNQKIISKGIRVEKNAETNFVLGELGNTIKGFGFFCSSIGLGVIAFGAAITHAGSKVSNDQVSVVDHLAKPNSSPVIKLSAIKTISA